MAKQKLNKIRHDIKRISEALKLLSSEIDALFVDIENGLNKEADNGYSDDN